MTTNYQTVSETPKLKNDQHELPSEKTLMTVIEVKSEPVSSDEEQVEEKCTEIATNYQHTEALMPDRNIDRLSMDSKASVDCKPSTSNLPVTPQIETHDKIEISTNDKIEILANDQIEISTHDEKMIKNKIESQNDDYDCNKIIKLEYEEELPTSTECKLTNVKLEPLSPHAENPSPKRFHELDCLESAEKRQKTNEEAEIISKRPTRWDGKLFGFSLETKCNFMKIFQNQF